MKKIIMLLLYGLAGIMLILTCSTGLYVRYRPVLTDPSENNLVENMPIVIEDLRSLSIDELNILAKERVDAWGDGAYLYAISVRSDCQELGKINRIRFRYLKINRLDIYPKQWDATFVFDFDKKQSMFIVEKIEEDPTPPLQRRLDLSQLHTNWLNAMNTAYSVAEPTDSCDDVSTFLHKEIWNFRFLNDISDAQEFSFAPSIYINLKDNSVEIENMP